MSLADDIARRRGKPLSTQERMLVEQSEKLQAVIDRRRTELEAAR